MRQSARIQQPPTPQGASQGPAPAATSEQDTLGNAALLERIRQPEAALDEAPGADEEAPALEAGPPAQAAAAPPTGDGGEGAVDQEAAASQGAPEASLSSEAPEQGPVEAQTSEEPAATEARAVDPVAFGTGNDAVDAWLDTHVTAERCHELQIQELDWIDTVNDVRGHPMGEAVINVGERLIPVYGAWDAVRDGWNGLAEQWEMVGDDWVMKTILVLQFVVGLVADIVSHIEYCVKLIGYLGYAAEGLGAVLNFFTSAAIGWVPVVCDAINFVLGMIGATWASYRSMKATDPQERARYQWLTYKQVEGGVASAMAATAGLVLQAATAGQAPSTVGREAARALVTSNALGGLVTGGVKAGTKMLFGISPVERPEPVEPMGRLPRDIFGDVATIGYLFTDEGTPAREKLDRFVYGTQRTAPPAGAPCAEPTLAAAHAAHESAASADTGAGAVAQPPQEVDHAPSQVGQLAQTEENLVAALQTADENVQASEASILNATAAEDELTSGLEAAGHLTGSAEAAEEQLVQAVPVGEAQVALISDLSQQFGELGAPVGQLGQSIGAAQQGAGARVEKKKDRSLLERARDWIVEKTLKLFLPSQAQVGSTAGSAAGERSEGDAAASAGAAQVGGLQGEEQASLAETQAAAGEAAAGVATAGQHEQVLQSELDAAHAWRSESEQELAGHQGEREQVAALLDEVRAERERQEAADAAFASAWSPFFEAQTAEDAAQGVAPIDDILVGGLWTAFDDLAALTDRFVAEGEALVGSLPTALRAAGREALQGFVDAGELRLARLASAIHEVPVGGCSDADFQLLAAAEGMLVGAEYELLDAWSEVLPALVGMADVGDALGSGRPAQAADADEPVPA